MYFLLINSGCFLLSFPGSSTGKKSTCNAGDPSSIPGLGRSTREGIGYPLQYSWASLVAQAGKESAHNAGDLGLIPGLGRSPGEEKGYPLQYSGLENPVDYIVHGETHSKHYSKWKTERISSKIRNKTRVPTLTTIIQHSFGSPSHGNQRRKRN